MKGSPGRPSGVMEGGEDGHEGGENRTGQETTCVRVVCSNAEDPECDGGIIARRAHCVDDNEPTVDCDHTTALSLGCETLRANIADPGRNVATMQRVTWLEYQAVRTRRMRTRPGRGCYDLYLRTACIILSKDQHALALWSAKSWSSDEHSQAWMWIFPTHASASQAARRILHRGGDDQEKICDVLKLKSVDGSHISWQL